MAEGYICRRGGVSLPSTITAGDTVIYAGISNGEYTQSQSYVNTSLGFTTVRAGIYRLTYQVGSFGQTAGQARITLSNVAVSGSEVPLTNLASKTIDIAISVGVTVQLQHLVQNANYRAWAPILKASILAPAIQTQYNKILTSL